MGAFLVNSLAGRRGENAVFCNGFITLKVNGFFTYDVLVIGLTRNVTLGEAMLVCLHLRDTKKKSIKQCTVLIYYPLHRTYLFFYFLEFALKNSVMLLFDFAMLSAWRK